MRRAITIALLLALLAAPSAGRCESAKVAVFSFKNNGQAQLNGLASGLAAMFTTDLAKSPEIEALDPQSVNAALKEARYAGGAPATDDALRAAAALNADYALVGEFVAFGSKFRIDVRLYDVKSGQMKMADKAQAKEDTLFDMVDELSDKMVEFITGAQPSVGGTLLIDSDPEGATVSVDDVKTGETPLRVKGVKPGGHKVTISLEDYQDFVQAVQVREKETARLDAKLVHLLGGIRIWWKQYPTSDIGISSEKVPMSVFQGNNILSKFCRNLPSGVYKVSVRLPFKDESSWENNQVSRTYTADMDLKAGEVMDIFIDNNLFSPKLDVTPCPECAASWDFSTGMSWYETK